MTNAKLLRDTASMVDQLKALLVPLGASPEGWDDWAIRLIALAGLLASVKPDDIRLLKLSICPEFDHHTDKQREAIRTSHLVADVMEQLIK